MESRKLTGPHLFARVRPVFQTILVGKSIFILVTFVCLRAWAAETGDGIWAVKMSGHPFFNRDGLSVRTDPKGNIYGMGRYSGELNVEEFLLPAVSNARYLAKYSDAGELLWAQMLQGTSQDGLAVDTNSNVYAAGQLTNSAFVAAFDPAGNSLWRIVLNVAQCNALSLHRANLAIAGPITNTTQFGTINVAGSPNGTYLASLNPPGTFRWARQAGTNLMLGDLSADPAGNLYIAGSFTGTARIGTTSLTSAGTEVFVAKFLENSTFSWARQFQSYDSGPVDVAADAAGNVYFSRLTGFRSLAIAKLNSSGTLLWERQATSADYHPFMLSDLAVDNYGNPYLAGHFQSAITFDGPVTLTSPGGNLFLAKYSTAGQLLGVLSGKVEVRGAHIDPFGALVVTGNFSGNDSLGTLPVTNAVGTGIFIAKAAFTGASAPPVIVSNPQSVGVVVGQSLNLSVGLISTLPVTYQWQLNNTNLPGFTNATFSRPNMSAALAGNYRVIVSNSAGALTSALANVSLAFVPTIQVHPITQVLTLGSNVLFNVSATGSQPLSYQWTRNGVPLPGATASVFILTNLQPGHAGAYRCIVSNPWGSATSLQARLDQVPHLQFQSPTFVVSEGSIFANIFITRAHRASDAVSILVATSPGSAFPDNDYHHFLAGPFWASGDGAAKIIQVPIINDNEIEENENFVVTLSNPSDDAVIGSPAVASVVILDNDSAARFRFESSAVSVNESVGEVEVRVLRSGGGGLSYTLQFDTVDNTAVAGIDYLPHNGALTFGPTDLVKTIFVPLIDDWPLESSETFSVRLHSPTGGATLTGSNTTVTITDSVLSFMDQFGHDLKIADFKNISGGFADWVRGTLVITNPSYQVSAPGFINIATSRETTNFTFAAIAPRSSIDVEIIAFGSRAPDQTNDVIATLYEDAASGPALQDTRAIYGFFYTAGGGPPNGGVPVGCCLTTGQPVPDMPYVTNLTILGPTLVNENSQAQYTVRAMLSHGVVNNAPSVKWGVTAYSISAAGLLVTTHVSSNTGFYILVTNVFNGVTQVASRVITNQDRRVRLLGPARLPQNRHRITLSGPANRVYNVQESTSTTTWTDIARVTNLTGTLLWTHTPSATATQRFYRAREH
jgi:Calx-beta domain/Immunoglobulin domain